MPSVRSVALGFWIRVGSRNETVEQAGISHFLEHLLFKGTNRFSSTEIDQIFDGLGAEINAGTGKETTSVYSRFLDQHLERAFDVMADMVLRPSLPGHRLRAPGGDRGDRHVRGRAVGQGARRAVARGVRRPSARAADHRHRRRDRGRAGARHRRVPRRALHRAQPGGGGGRPHRRTRRSSRSWSRRSRRVRASPTCRRWRMPRPSLAFASTRSRPSSTTSASARPGIPRGDDRRFILRVLDTILGGSTSSRLFQEVREKRGLAYSVYSYAQPVPGLRAGGAVRGHPSGPRARGDGCDRRGAAQAPGRHRSPRKSSCARRRT